MKTLKQNIILSYRWSVMGLSVLITALFITGGVAFAQGGAPTTTPDGNNKPCNKAAEYCSGFKTAEDVKKDGDAQNAENGNKFINEYIAPTVNALSALIGIIITGSIIYAGIEYATAGGDSGRVSAAKKRILKAIFVLVGYLFFYAFIKYLIPNAGL